MQAIFDAAKRSDGAFRWPGDAGLAVVLSAEYEPVYAWPPLQGGQPNYRLMAEMRYEATRGIWRVLGILEMHGLPATFFVNGGTAQKYPESVKAIAKAGHEVGAHSWNASDHFVMSRDEEKSVIARTVDAIAGAAGKRPLGWLTPRAQVSEHTLQLIADAGFTWHSDCFDDDLPYAVDVNGKQLIEVPRSTLGDDYAMLGVVTSRPFGSHLDMLSTWIDEFDVLYRESRRSARLLSINWHVCMAGRPVVSKVLDRFFEHIKSHKGIWFARGGEVADFWLKERVGRIDVSRT